MDMRAERNAFGRQIRSFEADVELRGIDGPPIRGDLHPRAVDRRARPDVEILAEVDGHPVAARQGRMLAVSFHAELGDDDRLHRLFLESGARRRQRERERARRRTRRAVRARWRGGRAGGGADGAR